MKNNKIYPPGFYAERHLRTVDAARRVVRPTIALLPSIESVVDFGCGVGSWLSVFKENGASVMGLDGPWVPEEYLSIPNESFRRCNLAEPIDLGRRYDLAISLEVAEHLPGTSASIFVENLVRHSDFILFSAAIPYQGGSGHINEQWPSYWCRLFLKQGYRPIDLIRLQIWHDEHIPYFYRQNICLYATENRLADLSIGHELLNLLPELPMDIVHPERFYRTELQTLTIKGTWKFFRRAIRKTIKEALGIKRGIE